jgi:nicotinate-nucleotide pyrophosphorylase (carboxylating)
MKAPFPPYDAIAELIRLAKQEDMGDDDVTSRLLIPEAAVGRAVLVQKQAGVICGLPIVEMVCRQYDPRLKVSGVEAQPIETIEGQYTSDPKRLPRLIISGPMRSLLSAERVLLNFVQRLSGVATQTHRYVQAVAGTTARIYDTRKTTPGWRLLEKYAVRCGGGENHRIGLYDGLLVKDNHLAAIPLAQMAAQLSQIVQNSRREALNRFIQIEVDTLDQLREVLKVEQIDSILLDNMDCPTMAQAVQMRNAAGRQGAVALEASGGVNLTTVRAIAQTGVERISVGALTHSAVSLDIGLDVE